jgi:hypothetical protein
MENILKQKPLSFKQRVTEIVKSLMFWKGRRKGIIYTRTLTLDDIRYIFWPSNFAEKYGYLGTTISYNESSPYFKALYPLILALDYEARPKWCPRWFLRFLHVFGDDKSIVRVRNRFWSNLKTRLTKGIHFTDWKTKWSDYDLRVSIMGPEHLQNLANAIETDFYMRGRKEKLFEQIKRLDPDFEWYGQSVGKLEQLLEQLKNKQDEF